jgi:hypothetical protein
MTDTHTTVAVNVAPAVASKINWTQLVSAGAMILSFVSGGKIGLTPEQQAALAMVIGLVTNAVTVVFRTWFSKTITPASIGQATVSEVPTNVVKIT